MFNHLVNFSGFGAGDVAWANRMMPRTASIGALRKIACSADGRYGLAARSVSGYLHTSSDFGRTWTQRATAGNWYGCAVSSTGQYMVAGDATLGVWVSSNYGVSWTKTDTFPTLSVTVSSTGQYMIAGGNSGFIYTSNNYGASWTQRGTSAGWSSVEVSDDGSKMFAAASMVGLYVSTNYGVSWTKRSSVTDQWEDLSCSADGTIVYACAIIGKRYKSSDGGTTWATTDAANDYWYGICTTPDGSTVYSAAGSAGSGLMYKSTDGGSTWSRVYQQADWQCVEVSDDDSKIFAIDPYYIYTPAIQRG